MSDFPSGRRLALVVATGTYQDSSLRQLRAPAGDATEFADVLADPRIGGFTVSRVVDRPVRDISVAVVDFLRDRKTTDLVLVYLSCHGLLDARNQLYFAGADTEMARLAATGLEGQWLTKQLEDCLARQQVVVLDCCFSGAFVAGAKGPQDMDVSRLRGAGRGRVVLTASRATEYSLEGEPVPGAATPGSVFTTALVEGLRTGEADTDNDGYVSVDEAYDYAFLQVRALGANQTPQRSVLGGEGEIVLARSVAVTAQPEPMPAREAAAKLAAEISAAAYGAETAAQNVPTNKTQAASGDVARDGSGDVARDVSGDEAGALGMLVGAADEMATLRQIRRALDDGTLEEIARTRPVPDLVKVVAALRAVGHEGDAADLLRHAALTRPVADVWPLVAAFRLAGHPSDADAVLAAAGSDRPPEEVVALAEAIGSDDQAVDVKHMLEWAARMRPGHVVLMLADKLRRRREDLAALLVRYAAILRPPADVAGLVTFADEPDPILAAFAERPTADAAHLVEALRDFGEDRKADAVLGRVEDLPPAGIAELVAVLGTVGREDDADSVLRWSGWRRTPDDVASLIGTLRDIGMPDEAAAVVAAGESRPVEELAAIGYALSARKLHADVDGMLRRAARRSADDVVKLMLLLEDSHVYGSDRHSDTLARHVGELPAADIVRVLDAELRIKPHAWPRIRSQLLENAGRGPAEQVWELVSLLHAAGLAEDAGTVIGSAKRRPPEKLAALLTAPGGAAEDKQVLVNAIGLRPPEDIEDVVAALDPGEHSEDIRRVLMAVPAETWAELDPHHGLPGLAASYVDVPRLIDEGKAGIAEQRERERARKRFRRKMLWVAYTPLVVYVPLAFILGAVLSRLLSRPRFGWVDWLTFTPTLLVALGILLVIAFAVLMSALENQEYGDLEKATTWWILLAVLAVIAGFVSGFAVDDIAILGLQVRDWLAWNF